MITNEENSFMEKVEGLPKKKMHRASKVNAVLMKLFEFTEKGGVVRFDPKKAGVNADSLRYQARQYAKSNFFPKGTGIKVRNKEWYFVRGK